MKTITRMKPLLILFLALVVAAVAWILRWRAITTLSIDYDEDDYIRAGQQYASLIRSGDWAGFLQTNYRPEHPPLAKMIYGVSLLTTPEKPLLPDLDSSADPNKYIPRTLLRAGRTASGVFGTLEVFILALVDPLAGLFLSLHTTTIKYTTEAMLEAVPAFTSLAAVVCFALAKRKRSKGSLFKGFNAWLVFSAVFLGLTAASKYIYCVVGFAILVDWFISSRDDEDLKRFFPQALLWGAIALAVFFVADPYLWPDPIGRLKYSVLFNAGYSTGTHVQQAGFPVWQPLVWMSKSVPWQGDRPAFVVALDALIFFLAAFGLSRLWRKERLYVLWLGIAVLFLLVWPTKWPQYILILSAPLGLAAAEGVMALVVQPLRDWWITRKAAQRSGELKPRSNLRQALPWLIPGILFFLVLTLVPLLFQLGISTTDFRALSIKDAFHGGLLKAIWGGLTGQVPITELKQVSKQVNYLGLNLYKGVLDYIVGNDLLFNNIMWTVVTVTLQAGLGLGVALLLWQKGARFGKFWQVLFILPWAIPEFIGALMWINVLDPERGWLALAVQTYGKKVPFSFLIGWGNNDNLLFLVLLIPAVWYGFPIMMLAARAGLKLVPLDVFDAAAIDGANSMNTFRYVVWPLLQPLLIPAIIVRSIFAFNQFYLFQAFFGPYPFGTLANVSYAAFYNGDYYISAIINIITVLLLVGFVILFNRLSKASEGVSYA
jgi:ABC-type sugar transport system permease subunit